MVPRSYSFCLSLVVVGCFLSVAMLILEVLDSWLDVCVVMVVIAVVFVRSCCVVLLGLLGVMRAESWTYCGIFALDKSHSIV